VVIRRAAAFHRTIRNPIGFPFGHHAISLPERVLNKYTLLRVHLFIYTRTHTKRNLCSAKQQQQQQQSGFPGFSSFFFPCQFKFRRFLGEQKPVHKD
jgi:hypothetical protein